MLEKYYSNILLILALTGFTAQLVGSAFCFAFCAVGCGFDSYARKTFVL